MIASNLVPSCRSRQISYPCPGYRKNGGTVDVGDSDHRKLSWLDVNRESFKQAWDNDRNELLIAWARSNVK
jgi:hypothetical protein